jgi:undecaprenyl-diphosphatase
MAVYSTGLVELPDLEGLLEDVGRALGPWTYLLVGVLAYAETAAFLGLVVPGETAIIVAGVVAGQGEIDIVALIALVWTCSVLGDLTGLLLGRRLGRPFLLKHGPKVGVSEERVHQVDRFFERHGGKAVFLGRFVGLARALAPFLAGASGMPLRRFLPYDVLGAGIQVTALCLLGFVFWHSLDRVLTLAKQGALALGVTIAVVVGIVVAIRWARRPDNRRRMNAWLERHTRWRFVLNRLTPGELGLELTTLLAVAAVAAYVLFGYLVVLDADTLTPGDRRAEIWSDAVRAGFLDELAELVQHLGSLPVVAAAVLLVGAWLLVRGERLEAVAIVGGLVLTVVLATVLDGSVVREAPAGGTAEYPQPHAAYAVAWVAIAIALRRAGPLAATAGLVTIGIVVAAAVGLAYVYLREDWFSDVAGGLALGALCLSLAGMAALVTRALSP